MDVVKLAQMVDAGFYTGVPDSQLRVLCDYLIDTYGIDPERHIIAANEGNAVGLAAGYHLATGKVAAVYMQNSGEGNIINPVASLLNDKVYGIPMLFIIGWRGEPGTKDEPQHVYQGEVTVRLLDDMGIESFVIGPETTENTIKEAMVHFRKGFPKGKQAAFIIRKNALSYSRKVQYTNHNKMTREEIIRHVVEYSGEDPIVSTTGKASRELFEIRESRKQSHKYDFLTVGSMGHSSSIALGIAFHKADRKVWCIDGDGAALMHMGAMAVIGASAPENLVHVIINNGAHETVGGMPTAAGKLDLAALARACGYPNAVSVDNEKDLDEALKGAKNGKNLCLIEVKCAIGARDNLGRPTTTTLKNKRDFMGYLSGLN